MAEATNEEEKQPTLAAIEAPDFERRSGRLVSDPSSRSPTRRDRDRVLYSDGFRRLGGVTQVALGDPSMALHNRLTHSLKVEQVGFSLYSKLSSQAAIETVANLDAVATACLAHDIGHPPFGHAGETELDSLVVCPTHRENPRTMERRTEDPCNECLLEDGFEGNAQTLRILAVLASHRDSAAGPFGLDLTRASLSACTKYPWTRGAPNRKTAKWGAYDCDAGILEWMAGSTDADPTLNAQIMDWADDISYAVHDIEDFFRAGLIPVDDYKPSTSSLETFVSYIESDRALGHLNADERIALDNLLEFFPTGRFSGRSADLAALDDLRGTLLTQFINAATVFGTNLLREPIQDRMNAVLQQLIWYHIIDDPALSNIQAGQRRVLRDIFESFLPVARNAYGSGTGRSPGEQALRRLPHSLRRAIELGILQHSDYTLKQTIVRGLLDYISSLSDSEAYRVHSVLRGREHAGHLTALST